MGASHFMRSIGDIHGDVSEIIDNLDQLIKVTENKYAYIYDSLPDYEREVNLSIREIEILLSRLVFSDMSFGQEGQSVIAETLSNLQTEFDHVTETFLNQDLIDLLMRTFLDKSGGDKRNFYELIKVAREVDEALSILRDLALNSIVYSIRAGEQGAAFQILSDRINQASMELGGQFKTMKDTINQLNDWNENFEKTLVEFIEYEDNLKEKYQNKFQAEFAKIDKVLKSVSEFLKDNLGKTKSAFAGVGQIMVLIQSQDIIRQNIENMAKCLSILIERENYLDNDDKEKCLDYIVFANKVLELSKMLMGNVEESLNESLFKIGQILAQMNDEMGDLKTDAQYLTRLFAGNQNDSISPCVLGDVFQIVLGQVVDLLYIKNHIDSKSKMLSEGTTIFGELMEIVETEFASINKLARGMKKMKVLIKIELARINLETDLALNSIVTAIDQVIDTINNNLRLFLQLRDYFMQNINEFNAALGVTRNKLANSTGTLNSAKGKLEITHTLARGAVTASNKEITEIVAQLRSPLENLSQTEVLSNLVLGINQGLEEVHTRYQKLQSEMFAQFGVQSWEEKEEDLKLLMEQFTCFVERKAMTDLTGAQDDIGCDSGDIVLF